MDLTSVGDKILLGILVGIILGCVIALLIEVSHKGDRADKGW